jgi:hypothetical protein
MKKFLWATLALFIIGSAGLGYLEYQDYKEDSAIAANPGYAIGIITDYDIITKTRKRRDTIEYDIRFQFLADGQTISGIENFSESSGEAAVEAGMLEIVYNKDTPKVHKLKSNFDSEISSGRLISDILKLMIFCLIGAPVIGLILALKMGWFKKDEAKQEPVAA